MPLNDTTNESVLKCDLFSNTARKKARKMNCNELLEKINELADKEKPGQSGTKGLLQRFRDYLGDDINHYEAIEKQQQSLRTYIDEYVSRGCGDPPSQAYQVSRQPVPAPLPAQSHEKRDDTVKSVAKAGTAVGVAYIAYRVIRMLPSLFPPLWETIPINLAVP